MDEPARKPIQDDVRETLVTAARRFMALHPDVTAVGLTIVSPTIRPEALSTVVVGAAGPPVTPEAWLLCARQFLGGVDYCNAQLRGLLLGFDAVLREMERRAAEARAAAPSDVSNS